MKKAMLGLAITMAMAGAIQTQAETQQANTPYPAAILNFEERGTGVTGYGSKVSDLLFAALAANPDLYLVDRAELNKTLGEHEINLSGMVTPNMAVQIGQFTGAKILVAGSVVEDGKALHLVAKLIGVETTRMLSASVQGKTTDDLSSLTAQLASQIAGSIKKESDKLVAKAVKTEDRIDALKARLGSGKRPVVMIQIAERHVGQASIDSAAETELALLCRETGFDVLDAKTGTAGKADVLIQGEGFSEFAMRRGNLVSVKARLEVKAVDQATSKVLATDRQTTVEIDLSEQIAGKKALQNAAMAIAERLLPKLANK